MVDIPGLAVMANITIARKTSKEIRRLLYAVLVIFKIITSIQSGKNTEPR